jgi:hypothetical protein
MLESNTHDMNFRKNNPAVMEHAGSGLEKIVAESLGRVPHAEAPLLAWPLICGSVVAGRTRALSFSAGILRVEVPDAGWKRELQSLSQKYLAAMNRYAGRSVKSIEFTVAQHPVH